MIRNEQIAALARTEEERILLLRCTERLARAQEREIPALTAFLAPGEQALLRCVLPGCSFFGGVEGAQRAVAYFLPDYLEADDFWSDGPIVCLRAEFFEKNALSHRDILGALMGAGVRRDAIGDIYVSANHCDFFVLRELAPYLLENLTSAGRHHLSLRELPLCEVETPKVELREQRVTVSSLRLDAVLTAAFHLSRGRSAEAIRAGHAAVNGLVTQKPDRMVQEGDELSLRGSGKLRLLSINGETRKARLSITLGIYV